MNILVNDNKIEFKVEDFPMLITGAERTGTSFFSLCLLVSLAETENKVLLFSAYKAAKDEFKKQLDVKNENAIIAKSGDEKIFLKSIKNIVDISDRIILIKNIENYSYKLFNALKKFDLIIFSGDIDKCQFADDLMKKEFKTKIFFSQSKNFPNKKVKELPKYNGRIISENYNGLITLEM